MAIHLITGRKNRGVDTCKNNKFTNSTPCGIHTDDTCHYVFQKAQTATLHYTNNSNDNNNNNNSNNNKNNNYYNINRRRKRRCGSAENT